MAAPVAFHVVLIALDIVDLVVAANVPAQVEANAMDLHRLTVIHHLMVNLIVLQIIARLIAQQDVVHLALIHAIIHVVGAVVAQLHVLVNAGQLAILHVLRHAQLHVKKHARQDVLHHVFLLVVHALKHVQMHVHHALVTVQTHVVQNVLDVIQNAIPHVN